jgi:nucleoside-diphosphate-sugar epimerase
MKIVVSGASGFIGSWICRILSQEHEVIALMRERSMATKLQNVPNVATIREDVQVWPSIIDQHAPEVLILNDWWGVGNEFRNDPKQFENIQRIQKLAESAIAAGAKIVIGVGSQAELGPIDSVITEAAMDNPTTLYGEAKVKTRRVIQDLSSNSDFRFIWMRIFSTYGPLDEGSWLIPNIVDSLSNDKYLEMTKGEQVWSYLHAYDLAMAFAKVISNPKISGIVNVGNPETISIQNVGSIIGKYLKREKLLGFGALNYRPDQVMKLQPLCETLVNAGWQPQIAFDAGIEQTIDWLQRRPLLPIMTKSGKALEFNLPLRP